MQKNVHLSVNFSRSIPEMSKAVFEPATLAALRFLYCPAFLRNSRHRNVYFFLEAV